MHAPVDHNDPADPLPQPALNEQRHVEHAHPLSPPPVPQHGPEHRAAHGWVHDRVQRLALRLVREHDAPERGAVQRAVGRKHARPERAHDGGEGGRARLDDCAREHVRVDDRHAVCAEEGGDGRLARGDSAREADDCGAGRQ